MADGPDFLVVGAQKCGTTTLYEDLQSHPGIFIPEKESSGLLDERLPDPSAVEAYRRMFFRGRGKVCGEVSTRYTMYEARDVTKVASLVLDDPQIIYVVRDPIARAISHHHHSYALGRVSSNADRELRERPEFVENSRYAERIAPWISQFGRDNIHIVKFEDYVVRRQATIDRLTTSLGLDPATLPDPERAFNVASKKAVATGRWRRIVKSRFYRQRVRPLFPGSIRRGVATRLLPKAAERPATPNSATIAFLVGELRGDVEKLAELTDSEPWWDLDDAQDRYHLQASDPGAGT